MLAGADVNALTQVCALSDWERSEADRPQSPNASLRLNRFYDGFSGMTRRM